MSDEQHRRFHSGRYGSTEIETDVTQVNNSEVTEVRQESLSPIRMIRKALGIGSPEGERGTAGGARLKKGLEDAGVN